MARGKYANKKRALEQRYETEKIAELKAEITALKNELKEKDKNINQLHLDTTARAEHLARARTEKYRQEAGAMVENMREEMNQRIDEALVHFLHMHKGEIAIEEAANTFGLQTGELAQKLGWAKNREGRRRKAKKANSLDNAISQATSRGMDVGVTASKGATFLDKLIEENQ